MLRAKGIRSVHIQYQYQDCHGYCKECGGDRWRKDSRQSRPQVGGRIDPSIVSPRVHAKRVRDDKTGQGKEDQNCEMGKMTRKYHRRMIPTDQGTDEPLLGMHQQHDEGSHSSNGIQCLRFFFLQHLGNWRRVTI